MLKKVICCLLLLSMLMSMVVLPVSASEDSKTPTAELCPCGCGAALKDVSWQPWNVNGDANIASGHYYLEGDYVQNQQAIVNSGISVVLDLRGYKLTNTKDFRMVLCYGYMAVLDSVGGGRLCCNTTGSGYGGVIMVATNETAQSVFELYSGTITLDKNHKGSRRGGLVTVGDTCSFRMYGGTVLNGTTYSLLDAYKDTKDDAGCIYGAAGASIEILGGRIIGGKADRYGGNIYSLGTTILKNCEIIGGYAEASGGNICQNGGTLTIENAVIRDGRCDATSNGGGNICLMSSAVMNVKNSTIRNGYSNYHGGNIYIGTASATLESTVLEAGAAANRGNNLYGATSAVALTVKNCDLPGDVAYVGKNLSLEGKVSVGLLNSGLRLVYGNDTAMVEASGLTEGSEIFVTANHTFADATANIDYFKGANRTVLTASADGLAGTYAASGELGGYCPHCKERVTWTLFDLTTSVVQGCLQDSATDANEDCTGRHIESGHYYLGKSLTGMAQYYVGVYLSGQGTLATKDVVIDLSGYNITANGRAFYLRPKDASGNFNQLTLLDSYGGAKITGSGANNQGGGVLYNENAKLTVYGGKYVYKPVEGRNVTGGGVTTGGTYTNIYGGILDGRAFTFTDASTADKTYTYNGGVLNLGNSGKNLTMTAGAFLGGEANQGGALYAGYNNTVNITGGQFVGGRAVTNGSVGGCGGNIRIEGTSSNKKGKTNISGIALVGGYSESNSGNFSAAYYTDITLQDAYVAEGSSGDYGGNIAIGSGGTNVNYQDLILNKGVAYRGANLYCAGTGARANIINCYVVDGAASGYGGNFYAGNGYLVVKGGVFDHGSAATYGGNIVANAGKTAAANYLKFQKDEQGNAPRITGGVAGTYGGNIYISGVLELNDAFINNGKAKTNQGQDIWYLAATASHKAHKLTFGTGVKGDIVMGCENGNLTEPYYAMPLKDTVCTMLNANVTLENVTNMPMLASREGMLYVGSVAVFDAAGNACWYATNADAIANCKDNEYIKVYTDDPVVLTKDCCLDINGHTVSVSGAYTLYGMDSTAHGGKDSAGKSTLSAETAYAADYTAPNGMRYIAVKEGSDVTWHCLDMKISSVSLRPGTAGMYYSAVWNLDSTLRSKLQSYGVALSLEAMPDAKFAEAPDTLYTRLQADTFVNGKEIPGAIVENIFSVAGGFEMDGSEFTGDAANILRGQQKIYATPYMVLTDGTYLLADDPQTGTDDVALSLQDVLMQLGLQVASNPETYRRYTPALRDFYADWAAAMEGWELNPYAFQTPAEDDVLDILMIGNSYCYYYVEELHEMAKAAGVKLRVCNLYYSGCDMIQHYPWWKTGEKKYQYFEAVDGGKIKVNGVSMEWALMQQQWDVLSFQLSSTEMRKYTVEDSLALHREARDVLYGYLREQFPEAKLYFHQNWSYDIGHTRDDGYVMKDLEQQIAYTAHIRDIATGVCAENNVQRINTGDAWELYRAACDAAGIPHSLTARLGKDTLTGEPHSGDGTHDGDIGGGQLLNAAVWYEILTGKDCRDTGYAPVYTYGGETYTLSDTMVEMLYDAAHKAVTEILPTYPEYNGKKIPPALHFEVWGDFLNSLELDIAGDHCQYQQDYV